MEEDMATDTQQKIRIKLKAYEPALLDKAADLDVKTICPLHGFVWRKNLGDILSKYELWSCYEPEEYGVMIAYASVYGNTENTAEILACRLRDRGIGTAMFDVSVAPASAIVSASFKWSHLVFASTTYNAGIFVTMEAVIHDLVAHNIQNRVVAVIENGSWAATSGRLIQEQLEKCKNINILESRISIKSSLKSEQLSEVDALVEAIAATLPDTVASPTGEDHREEASRIEKKTMFNLSYGLFVLTARDGDKDNGCIVNTVTQITEQPYRITVAVNKANYTHDMILKTGVFDVSILTQSVPFTTFKRFGFQSGKQVDKFADCGFEAVRTANGIRYIPENTNGIIAAKVTSAQDYGTHTLFVAELTEAFTLLNEPSVTYQYYFDHIKPKPPAPQQKKTGFVCKICGYIYEGDVLPDDFICPLCKHGPADFEPL